MLELKEITKSFGGLRVLDGVSFRIPAGIITGIIGPNGAGKTTLFNIITGFVRPDLGAVLFRERSVVGLRPSRISRLGITRSFQELRLFRQMTVADNLRLALVAKRFRGMSELFMRRRSHQQRQVEEYLHKADLWEKKDELVEELSYGEQKRLEYVRLLANDPAVLLLDEPAAGLDMAEIRALFNSMREALSPNRAICLIEHNIEVVRDLCQQVMVLHLGTKLAEGEPGEVLSSPEVRRVYVGS